MLAQTEYLSPSAIVSTWNHLAHHMGFCIGALDNRSKLFFEIIDLHREVTYLDL
jgi:hypothetical protein